MVLYFILIIDYIYAYFYTLLTITLPIFDSWLWFESSLLAVKAKKCLLRVVFYGLSGISLWTSAFFFQHSPLSLRSLSEVLICEFDSRVV